MSVPSRSSFQPRRTVRRTPPVSVWRVLYVRPRAEKQVEERLRQGGHDVFLPLRRVVRQWSDRKKEVEEPLFPGYLFVQVAERERLDVLRDAGVVRCVSFGSRPAVMGRDEVAQLRNLQAVPERLEAMQQAAVPVGTDVIVMSGPLKGVRGRVSAHPKPMYLHIEVPSIRQSVRVHVPSSWVMRATA